MKNKNIIKGMLCMATAGLMTSCSSSYLDLAPESDASAALLGEQLSAARQATRGIAQAMNSQYDGFSINQYNGEGYINTVIGEGMGMDCNSGIATGSFVSSMYLWNSFSSERAYSNLLPWQYYYGLIYLANGVLSGIDNVTLSSNETEADRGFVKAQALCYRAHSYTRLLQYYAPRWEDSNNGETYCLVLRTSQDLGDAPLSTMNQVKKQLYDDLDEAVKLFEEAGSLDREYVWETNKNVAYGLYARAAMVFHDWGKAQEMAHKAQEGYQVLDNNGLFAGFYAENSDLIWSSSSDDADIYYWSWGSHNASNGHYVNSWGIGGMAISLDLYNQMDADDVRRGLFVTPDKLDNADATMNRGGLVGADMWNSDLVASDNMDMSIGLSKRDNKDKNKKWGLVNFLAAYGQDYMANKFTGNLNECVNTPDESGNYFACYMIYGSKVKDGFAVSKGLMAQMRTMQIGASYKFWCLDPYGVSYYPFMRCTEMCITEAEAAYMAGDMNTAKSCLSKIQSMRIPGYKGDKSGQALLDEIRLCRRLELWGEGFNFIDLKRWNVSIERRAWKEKDPTSGNWPADMAMKRGPKEQAGWRFLVPASESDYNKMIDRSVLPQPGDYTDYK